MSDLDDLDDLYEGTAFSPRVRRKARRHARGETQEKCFRGHALTPENTNCYQRGDKLQRHCKKCARLTYLSTRERRS